MIIQMQVQTSFGLM